MTGTQTDAILRVTDLEVRYGPALALSELSFEVGRGRVLTVLGPNGAGKSTIARAVSGLVPVKQGRIEFDGRDITRSRPYQIRRRGLLHLPEGRGVFTGLSVSDNLRMAAGTLPRSERQAAIDKAYTMFEVLGRRRKQTAGTLSGGEQQMVSLARALILDPKLVIADEMSLGLAPLMVDAVFEGLARARDAGVTIIIVEQFVHRALAFADDCVVMSRGRAVWSGPAADAREEVLSRYLGSAAAA
ncbi:ABC transporter ATP-binding protein [uncultured Jatrophihabitans sp.]|uniref:ABC transporter ATP-binding protein n=1 Tax=uncultured Jatrophihabitans sp. TaxID=1610747 RepID=UPI0035CAE2F1